MALGYTFKTEVRKMALCPECGLDHHPEQHEPEPVVIDAGPNDQAVKIAKIEAKASLEREKLYTEQEKARLDSEIAALRAENEALRNPVASEVTIVAPETEPEPVVEVVGEPEPPENTSPVVAEPKAKKRPGWFDAYR
jgi:hypothetical protein